MKINTVLEADDGNKVVFQGVLEGQELAFVIDLGLSVLIKAGMMPISITAEERTLWDIHKEPEGLQ